MAITREKASAEIRSTPLAASRRSAPDRDGVDRPYRAKVMIAMVAGCVALWGAIGLLVIHRL